MTGARIPTKVIIPSHRKQSNNKCEKCGKVLRQQRGRKTELCNSCSILNSRKTQLK